MADFIVDMLGVARRVFQLMESSRSKAMPDSEKRFWERETYLDCNFPKVQN